MKVKTILVMFLVLFMMSTTAQALEWNIYGGPNLTSLEISNINNRIEYNNHFLELADKEGHITEDMALNYIPGFNLGVDIGLTDKINIDGQYQRYMTERNWKMEHKDTGYMVKEDWEIILNGVIGRAKYKVLDSLSLQGGLGYFFGDQLVTRKEEEKEKYEIEFSGSIGYLVGAQYNYQIVENVNLRMNGQYRILNMEIVDKDDYYYNDFDDDSFNGFDVQVGLNYTF